MTEPAGPASWACGLAVPLTGTPHSVQCSAAADFRFLISVNKGCISTFSTGALQITEPVPTVTLIGKIGQKLAKFSSHS